ncbi:MAG: hypothetical protein C4527_28535 [Candidatus Omnitrophota bacterium]|jgi:hypothetical protein|nr:MAG: hypothetical protein C4527_28535 [Candidatus Omnitrophota bacterium]
MENNRFHLHFRKHPIVINVLLILFASGFTVILFELLFRVGLAHWKPVEANIIRDFLKQAKKDITLMRFKPHPYLSYVRTDAVYEKDGIRIGSQFYPRIKPEDTVRIACLGGSTTMNKYPLYLKAELSKRPSRLNFEIMDFGCDGWTLMESTINYVIRVSDFRPDIVLVHLGVNDGPPRVWPNFQPDYAHFRKSWSNESGFIGRWLAKKSWFVVFLQRKQGLFTFDLQNLVNIRCRQEDMLAKAPPETIEPLKRNIRHLTTMVRADGGELIIAPMAYNREQGGARMHALIEENNDCLRDLAMELKTPLAETDHLLLNHTDWFLDNVHMKPEGDRFKCEIFGRVIWDILLGAHQRRVEKLSR